MNYLLMEFHSEINFPKYKLANLQASQSCKVRRFQGVFKTKLVVTPLLIFWNRIESIPV